MIEWPGPRSLYKILKLALDNHRIRFNCHRSRWKEGRAVFVEAEVGDMEDRMYLEGRR